MRECLAKAGRSRYERRSVRSLANACRSPCTGQGKHTNDNPRRPPRCARNTPTTNTVRYRDQTWRSQVSVTPRRQARAFDRRSVDACLSSRPLNSHRLSRWQRSESSIGMGACPSANDRSFRIKGEPAGWRNCEKSAGLRVCFRSAGFAWRPLGVHYQQLIGSSGPAGGTGHRALPLEPQRNSCPHHILWLSIISTAVDTSLRSMVLISLRIDASFFLYTRSREVDQDDAYLANSYQTIRPFSAL
jgi:hypothetical protein